MSARASVTVATTPLSIEDFLDWLETQEQKFELVDGRAIVQPWVKRAHSQIAGNVAFVLQTLLDRDRFIVHQGDFAIETGPSSIRYADVLVEEADGPADGRIADRPLLIVEVLSESTMDIDFGPKRVEYLSLASVTAYVILSQDRRHAWIWNRLPNGSWPDQADRLSEGSIHIGALGLDLPLAEIYRGLTLAG